MATGNCSRVVMEKPLPLVETGSCGKQLILNIENLERAMAGEDRPVTIVSVAGKRRIGKSYIARQLMLASSPSAKQDVKGIFPLGSSRKSVTKGVWFWKGDFPDNPERCMVLLDFEGLFCPEKKDDAHDLKLYVFALLISDVVCLNTQGPMETESMKYLHFASNISTNFNIESMRYPRLAWVLRDFLLNLEDGETPDEYMENTLTNNEDEVCRFIKESFPERKLFTFPLPIKDLDQLKDLETIPEHELKVEFVKETKQLVNFIKTTQPKTIFDGELKGNSLSKQIAGYLEAITIKTINPVNINAATEQITNLKAYERAIEKFKLDFDKIIKSFPVALKTLDNEFENQKKVAEKEFNQLSIKGPTIEETRNKFKKYCEDSKKEKVEENYKVSEEKCKAIIYSLYTKITNPKNFERYIGADTEGVEILRNDLKKIKAEYEDFEKELGPAKNTVYADFEKNEAQKKIDEVSSTQRENNVNFELKIVRKPGEKHRYKKKIEDRFHQTVKGRIKTLEKIAEFVTKTREEESSYLKKEVGTTFFSVVGSVVGVTGGLTVCSTLAVAGAPVAAAGIGLAAATGGASYYFSYQNRKNHRKNEEDLISALKDDIKYSKQLEDELEDMEENDQDQDFKFILRLANEVRTYNGTGLQQLKNWVKQVLPSLHEVHIKDKGASELLNKLLTSIASLDGEEKEESKGYSSRHLKTGAGIFAIFLKEAVKASAKMAGSLVIAFGSIFIVIDISNLYQEYKKISIADIFVTLSDGLSCLPPQVLQKKTETDDTFTIERKTLAAQVRDTILKYLSKMECDGGGADTKTLECFGEKSATNGPLTLGSDGGGADTKALECFGEKSATDGSPTLESDGGGADTKGVECFGETSATDGPQTLESDGGGADTKALECFGEKSATDGPPTLESDEGGADTKALECFGEKPATDGTRTMESDGGGADTKALECFSVKSATYGPPALESDVGGADTKALEWFGEKTANNGSPTLESDGGGTDTKALECFGEKSANDGSTTMESDGGGADPKALEYYNAMYSVDGFFLIIFLITLLIIIIFTIL